MALEELTVAQALKARFVGDTGAGGLNTAALDTIGARAYLFSGPQPPTYPFIWHQPLSALGSEGVGPQHCGMDAIWQVGVVARTENLFAIRTHARRVFTLLHGWNPTVVDAGDGLSYELFWEYLEAAPQEAIIDGVKYREHLTRWAVQAQPA